MTTELLSAQIDTVMAQTGVPGVAMGVFYAGQETLVAAGVTNRDHPLAVTDDTLFQIGSITKTMTATIAMQLVEQGKLDLDRPIQHYLPTFRLQDTEAGQKATLRHLFTHKGGWLGDHFEDTGSGDDALARYVATMASIPQLTPLGEIWSYNNAAFSLAGHVIEAVTGKPFETVAKEMLFIPLGMTMTFLVPGEIMTHRFVVGHTVTPEGTTVATPWPLSRSANPAGGVISTIPDMLRYARFHLNQGQTATGAQLVQPTTIAAMQAKQSSAGSMADAVGLSWLLADVAGVRTVGHGGATTGQIAQLLMVPTHNFALVILTNANRGREVTRDLTTWALSHYLGIQTAPLQLQQLSADALEPYVGYYTAQLTDVEVRSANGGLVLQIIPNGGFPNKESRPGPKPAPAPATFFGEDRVVITEGASRDARCEFLRDAQGTIVWFRVGGRVHRRQP